MMIRKLLLTSNILIGPIARSYSKAKNPFTKTWDVISQEIPTLFGSKKKRIIYPEHVDIVVIGGGFIGSSVAYWLKTRGGDGLSVVVLEKDVTYKKSQNNFSLGTLTQHYSLPENIELSRYNVEFLRNIKEHLNKEVDIQYNPHGFLILASEKYADQLEYNVAIQREHGVRSQLLTVENIKNTYPWINITDVAIGAISAESEGTFNSWALLKSLIYKSQELGAVYVNAEVVDFELELQRDMLMEGVAPGSFKRINKVIYKTPDGEEHGIKFAICVLAAGDESGYIARLANIGSGDGLLQVPLPIEKREFKVYSVEDSTKRAGLNTPLIMDTSGVWLRRDGLENNFICGNVPSLEDNPKDLLPDEYYNHIIKPSLINRVPHCNSAQVKHLSTELYDFNAYDDNGVLGPHPYHNNLFLATGFGKQGCQHAPGIGRAISDLVIDSRYMTVDLTRFAFDRLLTDQPLIEKNMY